MPEGVPTDPPVERRRFLASLLMVGGLLACLATLSAYLLAFVLPPATASRRRRHFLGRGELFPAGSAVRVAGPAGPILVRRSADGRLSAFSARCPHLGCPVHWDPAGERFLCPCHDGSFDAEGAPLDGPPATLERPLVPLALLEDEASGAVFVQVDVR